MAYQQVRLQSGETRKVAWIPKEFAELGKLLILTDSEDVWKVDAVYHFAIIEDPLYPEALIREHRKNTGDALPRRKS